MDYNFSKELINTFTTLGIDFANCGFNVVEAWFDIDPENKDFLVWLSKNLTPDNLIYAHEITEYEENLKKGLISEEKPSQDIIKEISEKCPGIVDSETKFEIECLEDELDALLEDKSSLENILHFHESLHKKEKLSLGELEKQYISSLNELQKSEEECFRTGCCLDEINSKLYDALSKCSEKLLEYEYPLSSTYISNLPLNKYHNQYKHIISCFGLLDRKEFGALPMLQSAVKTCSKLEGTIFHEKSDENVNNLKKKLYKSIQNRNYTESIKAQLLAESKFLDNFTIDELTNCLRSKQKLKQDIQMKSDYYEILSLELENLSVEASEKHIDLPSIAVAKQDIKMLQEKLQNLEEVENIFNNILAYHIMLYIMLVINNTDIQKSDNFFRSVHHYIAHNLTKCQLRMETMTDTIKQYNLFERMSLKERHSLLEILLKLLSGDKTEKVDVDILGDFQHKIFNNKFRGDSDFQNQVQLLENNNKILTNFLRNGPTAEFITIPFKVYQLFSEIDKILNTKDNAITATVTIWKDAIKQVSQDSWLKIKRQLWMYFLMQPHKVLAYIEKIKDEETRIRTESIQ